MITSRSLLAVKLKPKGAKPVGDWTTSDWLNFADELAQLNRRAQMKASCKAFSRLLGFIVRQLYASDFAQNKYKRHGNSRPKGQTVKA